MFSLCQVRSFELPSKPPKVIKWHELNIAHKATSCVVKWKLLQISGINRQQLAPYLYVIDY